MGSRESDDLSRFADMLSAMERSRGFASCGCCSPPIPRAWSSARSALARDRQFDAFAPPRATQERRPGERSPRRHVSLVFGQCRGAAATCCASSTPSAAPEAARASRRRSCLPPDERRTMAAPNDVKEIVREKYGQAAMRVKTGEGGCCAPTPAASSAARPRRAPRACARARRLELLRTRRLRRVRPDHLEPLRRRRGRRAARPTALPRLARLRQSDRARGARTPARPCSTSAPAAASTCCCRRGASARPARPTAST